MKPIIGIFPSYNEEKNQVFLNQSYFDAIIESGGIPVALPLLRDEEIISEIVKRFDGIILSVTNPKKKSYVFLLNPTFPFSESAVECRQSMFFAVEV